MGSCSSTNDKKQKNIKTQTHNKIIENNDPSENKNDSIKLKSSPQKKIEQPEINQPSIQNIRNINGYEYPIELKVYFKS